MFILLVLVVSITLMVMYMVKMPGRSHAGPFLPLSVAEEELCGRLVKHVRALAQDIGERNLWEYQALEKAALYIEKGLAEQGYTVRAQTYRLENLEVRNIEAELAGENVPGEVFVVGAHYDSVIGSPGANDNASGVAALLEIARLLRTNKFKRTVRFVGFVNEEPPFFQTEHMGSRVYARRCRERGEHIVGMISLETIGCYSDAKGTQNYPFPFQLLYPDTGNFIGFVGNISSRQLLHRAIRAFRKTARFPSEGLAAPEWIPGVGWSDQWSFWKEGYSGIMVTDTALFRYGHYHSRTDTPDKLNYERMARVVAGLANVVSELANTPE